MKKSKKLLAALLSGVMTLSLAACGGGSASQETTNTAAPSTAQTEETGTAAAADLAFEPYEDELVVQLGRLASPHTISSLYEGDTLEDNPYTTYLLKMSLKQMTRIIKNRFLWRWHPGIFRISLRLPIITHWLNWWIMI